MTPNELARIIEGNQNWTRHLHNQSRENYARGEGFERGHGGTVECCEHPRCRFAFRDDLHIEQFVTSPAPPQETPQAPRVLELARERLQQIHVEHGGHPATYSLCVNDSCWPIRREIEAALVRAGGAQEPAQPLLDDIERLIRSGHYSLLRSVLAQRAGVAARIILEELCQLVREAAGGAVPPPAPGEAETKA